MDIAINYLAVLAATIATIAIGALWYGPLFGKYWMKLKGYTPESMKSMKMTPGKAMALAALTALITSFVIALLVRLLMPIGIGGAFMLTLLVWIGFIVPIKANEVLFEDGDVRLFLFHIAQSFVALLVASLIITLWA